MADGCDQIVGRIAEGVVVLERSELAPVGAFDQQAISAPRRQLLATQYVIRNDGQIPMIINYRQNDQSTSMVLARSAAPRSNGRYGMVHVSTLLLPGEELTITAVAAKV